MLENLRGTNENVSTRSRGAVHSTEMKPYIESIEYRLEPWTPEHRQFYRSLEFTFDPGDFARGPSKIIAHIFDRVSDRAGRDGRGDEAELERGQVWRGGAFESRKGCRNPE